MVSRNNSNYKNRFIPTTVDIDDRKINANSYNYKKYESVINFQDFHAIRTLDLHQTKLKVLSLNINGLINKNNQLIPAKFEQLSQFAIQHEIHIIALQEYNRWYDINHLPPSFEGYFNNINGIELFNQPIKTIYYIADIFKETCDIITIPQHITNNKHNKHNHHWIKWILIHPTKHTPVNDTTLIGNTYISSSRKLDSSAIQIIEKELTL